MGNQKIQKVRDRLKEELEKHGKDSELTAAELETIFKVTSSIKAIDKICIMEKELEEEDYSYEGNSGRYGRHYGRSNLMSYDSGRNNMIHKLNDMMMDADDERIKTVLRNAINQL